jgi:hypothetical protein
MSYRGDFDPEAPRAGKGRRVPAPTPYSSPGRPVIFCNP